MKASSKLLTPFSVTGLSLLFALGSMALPIQAQENTDPTGGSFAPSSASATPANPGTERETAQGSGSAEALLRARQALARGELDVARSMVETARHLPLDSALTDDTPEKVTAMIARHSELAEMRDSGNSHLYNHGAVMFLLDQADRLVNYQDFATVEMLVTQARSFNVQFKPGDLNPDDVLARMRQAQSAAATARSEADQSRHDQAAVLLSRAQLAYDKDNLDEARQLIEQFRSLDVADDAFDHISIVPWDLELKIREAGQRRASAQSAPGVVQTADYYPELDKTKNVPVVNEAVENDSTDGFRVADARGQRLYDSGISAMSQDDLEAALEYFRMAWQYRDQLAPQIRQDLQTKISQLQINAIGEQPAPQAAEEIMAIDEQLRAQMFQDVIRQRAIAEKMVGQRNPRGALNHMRMTRDKIEQSDLDTAGKQQLIAVVEREIAEMERFIEQNISEIETDETNAANLQALETDRQRRDDVERKIQALLNDFNMLIDERRFSEADVLAQQAFELAPENEAVVLMMEKARFMGNQARIDDIQSENNRDRELFWQEEMRTERMLTTPERPIQFDKNRWDEIAVRQRRAVGMGDHSNEQTALIWSALKQQSVQVQYNETPLREAISILAERANVNMIFDTRALELEGVSIDTPVTHSITQPISVESALNIVLGGTGLVFKVEDEVVKITNPAALQANPAEQTYYVGDLVMPVPDYSGNALNMQFISPNNPSSQWNAAGGGFGQNGQDGNVMPINMMQQMPGGQLGFGSGSAMWSGAGPQTVSPQYSTWGPKGAGGGITAADFNELINLIQETIDPDSWEENGGTARMRPFPTTLSLIVTQTQENQDRIQDLLTRLRELNDVQIVVEVRFIRLRDDFFERIGIDFDFQINDSSGLTSQAQIPDNVEDIGGRITVGREPIGEAFIATADLDIPVRQNSFGSSVPQFGNFAADTALNFGFAILSDIEVFFLLQAAKGDERTNVTEAPTVTMFNGQSASVFDGQQVPFVTSITPVVGDFAAAQQPVITILPEGTQLNVRAVVSGDRRFVKMTLVPFFSQITQVDEFRFQGERRVRQRSGTGLRDILDAIGGDIDPDGLGNDELEIVEAGTTVQLPTFANTTITTTVSVPDGGTVLLGGIKSMSEGRTERGVPFLSNIPYVNRLFKNVGIGRETDSLMMMVTPRIIIQEEEEQFQVTTGN